MCIRDRDDPTAGLDPIVTSAISKLIDKIIRDAGTTALTITQDLTVIKLIANRVAMLHDGKIIWTGPAQQVTHSGNDYVDQFIHGRRKGSWTNCADLTTDLFPGTATDCFSGVTTR